MKAPEIKQQVSDDNHHWLQLAICEQKTFRLNPDLQILEVKWFPERSEQTYAFCITKSKHTSLLI